MTMKTLITSVGVTAAVLASPSLVFAQTASPALNAKQTARLSSLHIAADTAITARLTSLNSASARINGLAKLSSDQKAQFNGQITTDINALTALKSKADADTDLTTLRADYRSIFTTYRIYAEFLPQLHLLIASDTMGVSADKLTQFATKLQSRVQAAGNPSNLTSLLSDMQAKNADADTQYKNVQSQVSQLTPQGYDANPSGTTSILKGARSEIQTGANDLKASWADAKQIMQALKAMHTSASPSSNQ